MCDCPTIYHVPLELYEQGLVQLLSSKLCLKMPVGKPRKFMSKWRSLAERAEHLRKVRISWMSYSEASAHLEICLRARNMTIISLYRVGHLLADLGWVYLDLECSTIMLGQ